MLGDLPLWCTCGMRHECCMLAASTELDQPLSQGPVEWVRGLGSGQRYQGTEGLPPQYRAGPTSVCVLVNPESVMCLCLHY